MKMLIRIMILSKLTLRMKLDNGCDSALKNTVLPQIKLLPNETFGIDAS